MPTVPPDAAIPVDVFTSAILSMTFNVNMIRNFCFFLFQEKIFEKRLCLF